MPLNLVGDSKGFVTNINLPLTDEEPLWPKVVPFLRQMPSGCSVAI